MTDFENSAFVVFVVLLTRAILSYNLNMYLPISKVSVRFRTLSCLRCESAALACCLSALASSSVSSGEKREP